MNEESEANKLSKATAESQANKESEAKQKSETKEHSQTEYLCVDLDGTLLKTDLFFEASVKLVKTNFLAVFKLSWIIISSGRAAAKDFLANEVTLEPENLPISRHFFHYLLEEQRTGRKLLLVTASPKLWADKISAYFGIFSGVIASTKDFNCKGANKLEAIKREIGTASFEYAGNDYADLAIWKEANERTIISRNQDLIQKVKKFGEIKYLFDQDLVDRKAAALRALRPHQWSKNLLIFLPLLMAHQVFAVGSWLPAILAFIVFCFTASTVYLINDLLDLDADRVSKSKRSRPLANADLSIQSALLLIPILLFVAFIVGVNLTSSFVATLSIYFLLTTYYSFHGKRIIALDILILASLYSIRIFAGGAATGIFVSPWLIAFSMFFFLSLASLKRFIELKAHASDEPIAGRGYAASDLPIITGVGIASGMVAVLVLAFYTNNPELQSLYVLPEVLWFLCPVILYWLLRIWLLANRGMVNTDPVLFAVKDRVSYLVLTLLGVILLLAAIL